MITVDLSIQEVNDAIVAAARDKLHAYQWLGNEYEPGLVGLDGADLLSSYERAVVRFKEKEEF